MKLFDKIIKCLGYVRCRVCNKWTEPSKIEGAICSIKCLMKEIEKKARRQKNE